MQNLFWMIQPCYINKKHHQDMMCFWIKGHLSAKSVKFVAIFLIEGQHSNFKFPSILMEEFFITILLDVCLSCLESNDLPSFPRSNIHNRHVTYVTV